MGKTRNKWLDAAEIPRSVEQFLAEEQSGLGVRLLLQYIEELEQVNKNLMVTNRDFADRIKTLDQRVEILEDDVDRLKNKRIMKKAAEDKSDSQKVRSIRSAHGKSHKGMIRAPRSGFYNGR